MVLMGRMYSMHFQIMATLLKTLLQMKYAKVIGEIAILANITREEAMKLFFNSDTYYDMENKTADMHCRSDIYLAKEILNIQ